LVNTASQRILNFANNSSEGCPVTEFPPESQQSIINLFLAFNEYYPDAVLKQRLALFKKYLNETYFSWIGEFGDDDPYYYRIHSPVAFMELDFHCGSEYFGAITFSHC
jgi:hypothetical protein